MKYEYFISYSHNRGFGSRVIAIDEEIVSAKSFVRINNWLKSENLQLNDIVILNFIKLRNIPNE